MTFNKMRFPIVWITLALCVVLGTVEVHSGPIDQDISLASKDTRSARQESYDAGSDEENDDGSDEGGDDYDGDGDDGGAADDDDEEDEEERSLKRRVREASQKPLNVDDQSDEDSVIPNTDAPITDKPTKKPSVLLLLSTALDKAIAATTKLPTQQMASDAASVFLLLGQVFSEAIDKVIGDDGPEEVVTEIGAADDITETPIEELTQLPIVDHPVKVEKQPEIDSSQSDKVIVASS